MAFWRLGGGFPFNFNMIGVQSPNRASKPAIRVVADPKKGKQS